MLYNIMQSYLVVALLMMQMLIEWYYYFNTSETGLFRIFFVCIAWWVHGKYDLVASLYSG